jgi:hypothetical protein
VAPLPTRTTLIASRTASRMFAGGTMRALSNSDWQVFAGV